MRFTDRSITALKPRSDRYEVWEDGRTGFGVRVAPSGRKSWIFMYRFDGKPRRMTLGVFPLMGLADAGLAIAKAKQKHAMGRDPAAEAVADHNAERQAETVEDLFTEYLEKYSRPRKRSSDEHKRCFEKDILPHWGNRKAKSITRRDGIILFDRIVDRGAPIMANRTLAVVRKVFAFGVDRDILAANPLLGIRPPGKEVRRDRVLSDSEIKTFWNELENATMPEAVRLALKLLLVTIQRRSEVMEASWAEFDLSNGNWTIDATRTKNGIAHTIPLSEMALVLLSEVRESGAGSRWLFPSPRLDDRPISRGVINHCLAANREVISVKNLRPHDLRRTGASQMTAMGIPRLVVGKILNHTDRSITAVYDRHEYGKEKRHALNAWGTHLTEIIGDRGVAKNVVPLSRG
ncbi:MAG: tyrosine-type recombinase/integrase [Alphaproteobacteria bacterium]